MLLKPLKLEQQIAEAQADIDQGQRILREIRAACRHIWSKPVKQVRTVQVQVTTDKLIAHGSDIYPELKFAPQDKYYFERTCSRCGLTEETTRTRPTTHYEPDF